jgi:hypothetical protein
MNEQTNHNHEDQITIRLLTYIAMGVLLPFDGFIIMTLWNWFIVEIFNAPTLTLMQGIGISLVAYHFRAIMSCDSKETIRHILFGVSQRLFLLSVGFIVALPISRNI